MMTIVGIDEAGRGALAGPVVAAACVLVPMKRYPVTIGDSKQMSAVERERSYVWLKEECLHGIGLVDAKTIDKIGILAATERAMQMAVQAFSSQVSDLYLLVDGRDAFWFDHPHSSIVRGDQSEACIGAASILAKVTRDHLMVKAAAKYEKYGFERHKGYGTLEHFAAIRKNGASLIHRKSFLKNVVTL